MLLTDFLKLIKRIHQAQRLGPRVVRYLTLASIIILVVFGGVLLKQGLASQ
jgi:hypothetical protein